MKYMQMILLSTLLLFLGSSGAQASFKWDACKAVFSKHECEVYEKAYETLKDLDKANKTISDLGKKMENLENDVELWRTAARERKLASEKWKLTAQKRKLEIAELESKNEELKRTITLLEPGDRRYQKFMQMFPQKDQ